VQAINILKFMGEKGVLMALKAEQGPWQAQAQQAFFELMNPKVATDALPEAKDPSAKAGTVNVKKP
jgi:hypothetical protein